MADQTRQSIQKQPIDHNDARVARIGCVSYLNAKPLIHGVDTASWAQVRFAVPSALLAQLEDGKVDVALCPVIDLQRSCVPLAVLPVGGIGCMGPTLTVRLLSRSPLPEISQVAVDLDSHTSVALLRVLLDGVYGLRPRLVGFDAAGTVPAEADAVLLIGDKVVTGRTPAHDWPHQLDLGEAWHRWTGLPFVFAVWMCRADASVADVGNVARQLDAARLANAGRITEIAAHYAPLHGWPEELARDYLGRMLRFGVGSLELEAIGRFFQEAADRGVIEAVRPMQIASGADFRA